MKTKMLRITLVLAAAVLLSGCAREIPPGNTGILFDSKTGISEHVLKPRIGWVAPWQQLIVYPTTIHNATYVKSATEGEKQADDSIKASTSEGTILPIDITVAYHVNSADATKAFRKFGSADMDQIQRRYIRWITNYGVNVVAGKKSIFTLTTKERASFGKLVKEEIAPILSDMGITVDDVLVGEIHPPAEITEKVQELIGVKNSLATAKLALQEATITAKTTLTNAQKDADLNALNSQQAAAVLAQRRIALRRKAIMKWDGEPPLVGSRKIPFTSLSDGAMVLSAGKK